jgi:recombination protein RecT
MSARKQQPDVAAALAQRRENPNGTGTAVATRRPDPARDLLMSMEDEFAACLPKILPLDMFIRVALTGFRKVPELLNANRKSLLGALLETARLGLAPCTEEASLVPFGNEITLIVGYQGYVQLMYRSGLVGQVEVDMVFEADEWEYTKGDGGRFFHKPNIIAENAGERGAPLFTYSYATLLTGGRTKVAITTHARALALQKEYGRKPKSAWNTNFHGMWLKSPIRQVQKYAPKSSELRRAIAIDGASFTPGGDIIADNGDQVIEGEAFETEQQTAEEAVPEKAAPVAENWPAVRQPGGGEQQ